MEAFRVKVCKKKKENSFDTPKYNNINNNVETYTVFRCLLEINFGVKVHKKLKRGNV